MGNTFSIVELIDTIKERPAMDIGRNSIFCLRSFLEGVCFKNENVTDKEELSNFQDWIVNRFEVKTTHA